MDPHNGGDLLCSQEGVYPVPRRGRREGGPGHGRCPVQLREGDSQDPLRVRAGRDAEEEKAGARALLPEDLPPVVGTPCPGEGGRQVRAGPAGGCVHRWWEGGAPGRLPGCKTQAPKRLLPVEYFKNSESCLGQYFPMTSEFSNLSF